MLFLWEAGIFQQIQAYFSVIVGSSEYKAPTIEINLEN